MSVINKNKKNNKDTFAPAPVGNFLEEHVELFTVRGLAVGRAEGEG